jgi:hypothetical protein
MAKLKSWGDQFPLLGAVWTAKERFFACWNSKSRAVATRELDAWAESITGDVRPYFAELLSAWSRRRDDILNYFNYPMTNAYTESINRLAKSINRMGCGYTLEVVRAKMLYDTNALEKGTMTRRVAVPVTDDDLGGLGLGKIGYARPEKPTARQRSAIPHGVRLSGRPHPDALRQARIRGIRVKPPRWRALLFVAFYRHFNNRTPLGTA